MSIVDAALKVLMDERRPMSAEGLTKRIVEVAVETSESAGLALRGDCVVSEG